MKNYSWSYSDLAIQSLGLSFCSLNQIFTVCLPLSNWVPGVFPMPEILFTSLLELQCPQDRRVMLSDVEPS